MLVVTGHYLLAPTQAAQLGNRSMTLSSDEISVATDYLLSFELSTAGPLGSIEIQFARVTRFSRILVLCRLVLTIALPC